MSSTEPVCRWCYVMSRHRHNGPLGSLKIARECARGGHRHPDLRAAVRDQSSPVSPRVEVVLEKKARPSLPPLPRSLVVEVVLAAERIIAES